MDEKVRVMSDGNRVVVVIEDPTQDLINKVKEIFGVTIESITGLDNPPSKKDMEIPSGSETDSMFIFPQSSKYSGKTVLDILSAGDIGYLHFVLVKIKYKKKFDLWKDLNQQHEKVAEILQNKFRDSYAEILKMLCEIYDHEPDKNPVTPKILENIGVNSIDEALKNENDAAYVFETIIEYIKNKK